MTIFTRLMVDQVVSSLEGIIRVEENQLGQNGNKKSGWRLAQVMVSTLASNLVNNDPLTTAQLAELAYLKERVLFWANTAEKDEENLEILLAWVDASIAKIGKIRVDHKQLPNQGKVYTHLQGLRERIQGAYTCLDLIKQAPDKQALYLDQPYDSQCPKDIFLYHTARYFVRRVFAGKNIDTLLKTAKAKAILEHLPSFLTRYKSDAQREQQIQVVVSTIQAMAGTNQELCRKPRSLFSVKITGLKELQTKITLSKGRLGIELACILDVFSKESELPPITISQTVFTHLILSRALSMLEHAIETEKKKLKSVIGLNDSSLTSAQLTQLYRLKDYLIDLQHSSKAEAPAAKDEENKNQLMALFQQWITRLGVIRVAHNHGAQTGETQTALRDFRSSVDVAFNKLSDCSDKPIEGTQAVGFLDRKFTSTHPMSLFLYAAANYLVSEVIKPEGGDAATRDKKEMAVVTNLRNCASVIKGVKDEETILAHVCTYLGLIANLNKQVSADRQPTVGATLVDAYAASLNANLDTQGWALGRLLFMVCWAQRMVEGLVSSKAKQEDYSQHSEKMHA